MARPIRVQIEGLFGNKSVDFPVPEQAVILVGPNGLGKSTVSNIFYFFITRQWQRLVEYKFNSIEIIFDDGEVLFAHRDEISGLVNLDNALSSFGPNSRLRDMTLKLRDNDLLERFLAGQLTSSMRKEVSDLLNIPGSEVHMFRRSLMRRVSNDESDLFNAPRAHIDKALEKYFPGRALYLPTYRRIEKDIQEIFPDFEERLRGSGYKSPTFSLRSSDHFVDLVSFGMEDVRKNIQSKLSRLRDYSLAQFNALSGRYLRDVIRGNAEGYSEHKISGLSEGSLSVILGRVSEEVLPQQDKALLRDKIYKISANMTGPFEPADNYLAHYFTLLMDVSDEISEQEKDVISFIEVCNAYLHPSKEIVYDDTKFSISILDETGRDIDLSSLSSGEKQVVSLFSHLYLDNAENQIVIIDEPELSLSVPWQKRFLPDILASQHCDFVFAVTHSPFIYQNELAKCAVDLRTKAMAL